MPQTTLEPIITNFNSRELEDFYSSYLDGYTLDASDLGIQPGWFPTEITVKRPGNHDPFVFRIFNTMYNDDNELMAVIYKTANQGRTLIVVND